MYIFKQNSVAFDPSYGNSIIHCQGDVFLPLPDRNKITIKNSFILTFSSSVYIPRDYMCAVSTILMQIASPK